VKRKSKQDYASLSAKATVPCRLQQYDFITDTLALRQCSKTIYGSLFLSYLLADP